MLAHQKFGGVIPEIASRSQLEKITPIIQEALDKAQVTLDEITTIAVTNKPGLPGSLLAGLCFAKSIAWSRNKKLIGVNHLEGHVFSSYLEHNAPFPHLCLTASGGHTSLYLVKNFGEFEIIGQTIDDAAGEAFDKVSKLLDLGYPGGPIIEKRAASVDFKDFFHYPRSKQNTPMFSFSGLKTAVMYDLVKRGLYDMKTKTLLDSSEELKNKVASSFLVCVADIFEQKIKLALKMHPEVKAITFVGGVACNKYIKNRISQLAQEHNVAFYSPSAQFCTDNGAMIAFVGHYKALNKEFSEAMTLDIFK
jgi:N6-L-threonylcarbamoyladenine synthase